MAPPAESAVSNPTQQKDFGAFRLTPDLRFLFPQPAHEAAFEALRAALGRDVPLLLATGDIGIGKTILARRIEEALRCDGMTVAYVAYPDLGIGELLQSIQAEFGLRLTAVAKDAAQAAEMLTAAPRMHRVLLVDDADACSTALLADLDALARKTAATAHPLQVILFGTSDLPGRIAAELPGMAVAHTKLSPLSTEETATYIRHRLAVLGSTPDVFSKDAVAAIASYARGIPRLVNQACGRALLLAGPNRDGAISQAMVREAINDCPAVALTESRQWADADSSADTAAAAPTEAHVQPAPSEAEPTPLAAAEPAHKTAITAPTAADAETSGLPVAAEPTEQIAATAASPAAQEPPAVDALPDYALQMPVPPSIRKDDPPAPSSGPPRHGRRPRADRLRLLPPREGNAMKPGATARFAGFVPRGRRTAPPVDGAGPIDATLRISAAPRPKRQRIIWAMLVIVGVAAAGGWAATAIDPKFVAAARDGLSIAEAVLRGVVDSLSEAAERF